MRAVEQDKLSQMPRDASRFSYRNTYFKISLKESVKAEIKLVFFVDTDKIRILETMKN